MKQQVTRLSPHQNGKVFAVLMAISSLAVLLPLFLLSLAFMPPGARGYGPPGVMIVILPLVYLVVGYGMVGIGCWLYNLLVPLLGGIEFELQEKT